MSRLLRKTRPYEDLVIKSSGGIMDLFDNAMKEIYRITDIEYNYLAKHMTDDELGVLMEENLSFAEKRQILVIIDKYLAELNKL